jgi:predicted anti-sigma-YlaC factor YlaD
MDCQQAQHAIVDSFIEPPSAHTRGLIEAHLAGCQSCAAFARAQRDLDRHLTARLVPPALSAGFRAAVRTRTRREARAFWWDLLPDAVHFVSCGVATLLGLLWLPISAPVVIAAAAVGTMLTHAMLTAAHDSFDAVDEITQ